MRGSKCHVKLINQRQADVAVVGECGWNPSQRLNMPSKFWNLVTNSRKIYQCWMSAWTSPCTFRINYRHKYCTDSRTNPQNKCWHCTFLQTREISELYILYVKTLRLDFQVYVMTTLCARTGRFNTKKLLVYLLSSPKGAKNAAKNCPDTSQRRLWSVSAVFEVTQSDFNRIQQLILMDSISPSIIWHVLQKLWPVLYV